MPRRLRRSLVALALGATAAVAPTARAAAGPESLPDCPRSEAEATLPLPPGTPQTQAARAAAPGTYSHVLKPTPAGWPVRDHWCIWIEPVVADAATAAGARERQWLQASRRALEAWGRLIGFSLVQDPDQAQVRLWRRRPPLLRLANGRTRASHGRAVLHLLQVKRQGRWQAEPRVEVLLSPGQAPLPMQATALHELGHAFGLWGHSDEPGDALAAVPGPQPVLNLSPRDQATLRWLLRQDGRLQMPPAPAENRSTAPARPTVPTAD